MTLAIEGLGAGLATTAFRMVVSGWLVAVALWDRAEHRIPNALVLPALVATLAWRLYLAAADGALVPLGFTVLAWGAVTALWALHLWGAGDAKLLMVLLGLFLTVEFVLLLALAFVVCELPPLVARLWRTPKAPSPWLPSAQRLSTQGRPDAWVPALAGVLYAWCLY